MAGKIDMKMFRALYDELATNHPQILRWTEEQAKWHRAPLGAIFTWKEEEIRRMMEKERKLQCD